MHLLPLCLGRLAEHAARCFGDLYATASVLLRVNPDNTFEAVATDTKVLVRVTGPCVAEPAAFPDFPDFAAKPDGAMSALIPADAWRHAFTWGRKLTAKSRTSTIPLKCVAVRIGETETAFAAANEFHSWCESVENVTGRYPPYRDILSKTGKDPRDRFGADPRLFGELLRTAAELQLDAHTPEVVVNTDGPQKPVSVHFGKAGGLEFTGVLAPLALDLTPPPPGPALEAEPGYATLQAERDELARDVNRLRAERDDLARRVDELAATLAALAAARIPSIPGTQ